MQERHPCPKSRTPKISHVSTNQGIALNSLTNQIEDVKLNIWVGSYFKVKLMSKMLNTKNLNQSQLSSTSFDQSN